jgi:polyisoprenyl-phosphate glycosyltransferase
MIPIADIEPLSAGNLPTQAVEKPPVPDLSIVLPAYDEAANIAPLYAALRHIAAPFGDVEILFVDDGSRDSTLAALRAIASGDPTLRYVSFTRNFGHQAALRAGLRHARGRAVIIMDADFEHPPELIPTLVAAWRGGAKVVAAQRKDDPAQVSPLKRTTSSLFYRLLDAIGDVRIAPGSADYMLLDRAVVDVLNGIEAQEIFLRGLVRWLGYPLATVPFSRGQRRVGDSKYSLRRMVELAVTGISAHSVRPLRIAVWLALGFAALGALLLVYSFVSFVFIQHTVAGWSSIMAAIALLGAAQLLVLGIIGEYVGRILGETRRRPVYIIAETEDEARRPDA